METETEASTMDFEIGFYESLHRRLPKDKQVVELLGHLYTRNGRISEGLKMDRKMVRLDPHNPLAHYNLGCSLALKDRKKEAVESLRTAVELGYDDLHHMLNDEDLQALQSYEPFVALMETMD